MRSRSVDEVLAMVKHGLKAARYAPDQNGFHIAKKRQARLCPSQCPAPPAPLLSHSKHATLGVSLGIQYTLLGTQTFICKSWSRPFTDDRAPASL